MRVAVLQSITSVALCLFTASHAMAQAPAESSSTVMDIHHSELSRQAHRASLTGENPIAVNVIAASLRASNSQASNGICASGTLSLDSTQKGIPVELSTSSSNATRLDVTLPSGIKSYRYSGSIAGVVDTDGKVTQFSPFKALAGYFFTIGMLQDANASTSGSVRKAEKAEGKADATVIYTRPVLPFHKGLQSLELQTTLKFDPDTRLLKASADDATTTRDGSAPLQRVIEYDDYTQIDQESIATTYREFINGQHTTTLRLTSIRHCTKEPSAFALPEVRHE